MIPRSGRSKQHIALRTTGLLAAAFLGAMIISQPAGAYDIDSDYSGVIDTYNGAEASENTTVSMSDRVYVDTALSYDRKESMFVVEVTGLGSEVYISVCDGMMTTDPVRMVIPTEVLYHLYRDGQEISFASGSSLSDPGSYVLDLSGSSISQQQVRFTILSKVTGLANEYRMPSGFAVSEVLLDNEPLYFSGGVIPMEQEGRYEITYYCLPTGIGYKLGVLVDHTAPELLLSNVVDGVAKGPVSLEDAEQGSTVVVRLNAENIAPRKVLTQSGSYTVTITDEAGNYNTYNFRIRVYFNTSAWTFIGIFLAVFLFVIGYIIFSRKTLRVR